MLNPHHKQLPNEYFDILLELLILLGVLQALR